MRELYRGRGSLLGMILWIVSSAAVLHAQGTSGNLTGQVLDPVGAVIPGARLVATNTATNVSTATTSTEKPEATTWCCIRVFSG